MYYYLFTFTASIDWYHIVSFFCLIEGINSPIFKQVIFLQNIHDYNYVSLLDHVWHTIDHLTMGN